MDITITPGRLAGTVAVPPSKSDLHRKCIAAAFCAGETAIRASALCGDTRATLDCLAAMGFAVSFDGQAVRVGARDEAVRTAVLDCGESGSTARFLLPAAAYFLDSATLTGHGRLPERPFAALTDALRACGTAVSGDLLPITVSRGLHPGVYRLRGDVSSQFLTGLLLALPALGQESRIELTTPLESAPYVELTNRVLRAFGVEVEQTGNAFRIPAGAVYRAPEGLSAEGDWSSGAFWLLAKALGCDVSVTGLSETSAQGDRRVTVLLEEIRSPMPSRVIDMEDIPDLLPVLAVAAGASSGRTVFRGASRLRLKESDRLQSVCAGLRAIGGFAEETADGVIVEGTNGFAGGRVDACGDHRIAMAFAVAAAASQKPVTVCGAESAAKSYETFFQEYERLGGKLTVEGGARV